MNKQISVIREALEAVDNGCQANNLDFALNCLTQLEAMAGEPARPDIIEKLTYHARERDDMTMDDCLSYLNTKGWHKVRGRTERELILQITALLAAAPVAQQPRQCGLCGSDEAFAGTCGGGKNNPRALCYEPVAQQPQAECAMCGGMGYIDGIGNRCGLCDGTGRQPQAEAVPCGSREYCGRFPFCGCGNSDSLPERDTTKPAEQQGLFRKFVVRRTDGSDAPGGKHDGCDYFVLDVTHDKHAKAALAAYAASVEETHPQLATDMRDRYGLAAPQQAEAVPTDADLDSIIEKHLPSYWQYGAFEQDRLRALARTLTATKAAPQQAEAVPLDNETKTMKLMGLVDDLIAADPDRAERFIETVLARNALQKRLKQPQAEAVPSTHVMVPVEPTDEMIDAACEAVKDLYWVDFVRAYKAAIAQQKGASHE